MRGPGSDYILCSQRWRSSIQSAKTRPGADCGSDHQLLIAKCRLNLKKVGKTTRSFRYDLNQIFYDYEVQFSSVAQSCPTLCDPVDCSTPGLPVHHQLLEFTQTHVHWVDDAIQPSHPLLSPSPSTFNLSQHQGLFKWVSSSHQVAKVLEFQLQHIIFPMNIEDWFPLVWTGWISLQSKGLSRVFSNTTVQKHQFFDTKLS